MMGRSLFAIAALVATVVATRQVSVSVDASISQGHLPGFNQFFGCDEPNYAYYPQGAPLIKELGALGKTPTYFRTHNLLTTGEPGTVGVPGLKFGSTNAYTLDDNGEPVYNFTITDKILDSYMTGGVKPYLEVGFMPYGMATDPRPYFFLFNPYGNTNIYLGWSHTPKSYDNWEELVYQWTKHNVERYGTEEMNSWYFEIWNEPNIAYWNGTTDEFYDLFDHAVNGIRKALPSARIGGAEVAGGVGNDNYLGNFIDHALNTSGNNLSGQDNNLNFVSWHAKGAPLYINSTSTQPGFIQMNVSTQLQQIDQAFALVATYPQLRETPIFMSEYDPDSCAGCLSAAYNYRNSLMYPAYSSASFIRALDLAASHGVNLQGMLTWAFEYEPTKMHPNETQYFDGFRVISTQGIDKAVLNVHRMWTKMTGGNRVSATSSGMVPMNEVLAHGILDKPDVGAFASTSDDGKALYVFVWHYHDNYTSFPDVEITTTMTNIPELAKGGVATLTQWRIDEQHSDPWSVWQTMGAPQPPSQAQKQTLVQAGKLAMFDKPKTITVGGSGKATVDITLPIRGMHLFEVKKA